MVSLFKTKKRFGQHFLNNEAVLACICDYAGLSEGESCIEIGPGQGALTKYLLKTGADIHAIEIDRRLESVLEKLVNENENFSFTMADALEVDLLPLFGDAQVTVIGNLPYEISTPLLFKLVPVRAHLKQMVFLLQKEVVERIIAPVGSSAYGRLSVMMQYYFEATGLMLVGPENFSPPPKVISQVVMLKPVERDWVNHDELSRFVKYLFAQKRKMLRQRFKGYLQPQDWEILEIDSTLRPGNLDLDKILRVLQYLQHRGSFLNE
jgi:16S rRNA (adenine1518-N6/adenine1519-N6)-dimethyltransferase